MYTGEMATPFTKLCSRTLRDQISEKIREAILAGSLAPGERLVERRLSDEFGASLTAVREALICLEADGFVVKKPNSSTYVTQYSFKEVEKAFEFRRMLEGYAIEEAIRLATPEQIKTVESSYMDMVDAAGRGDHNLFLQKDYDWHEVIWRLADNEYLLGALKRLILPLFAFSAIRIHSGRPLDLLADAYRHHSMLEALRTKNLQAGRNALNHAIDEWLMVLRAWEMNNR
jgi:DNA-binding GntR family transcriptional regulator